MKRIGVQIFISLVACLAMACQEPVHKTSSRSKSRIVTKIVADAEVQKLLTQHEAECHKIAPGVIKFRHTTLINLNNGKWRSETAVKR